MRFWNLPRMEKSLEVDMIQQMVRTKSLTGNGRKTETSFGKRNIECVGTGTMSMSKDTIILAMTRSRASFDRHAVSPVDSKFVGPKKTNKKATAGESLI